VTFTSILNILFPSACVGCGAADAVVCQACRPARDDALAFRVGALGVDALGVYEGSLRRAILAFKRGRRDAGDALGDMLAARFAARLKTEVLLVPVPTTARRRAERGFDQAVFLAQAIGRRTGLGVLDVLLQTAGDAQRGRSRSARLGAGQRFRCAGAALVAGTRVVLIDDVATTGATLRDCARALDAAGARVSGALVLAHALEVGQRFERREEKSAP
jgi:ComF family protein